MADYDATETAAGAKPAYLSRLDYWVTDMIDDPIFWVLAAPGLLLGLYAQSLIKANFTKYSQVYTNSGVTGAQVARWLLDSQGLRNVRIETTPGLLSDHYDPRSKVLRLSQEVYNTPSLAAAGIAAHETGHALQDAVDYFPMEFRSYIVPLVLLSSKIAPWMFFGGLVLGMNQIAWAGVILFSAQTFFTLVTLPVEFDASRRARELLITHGLLRSDDEIRGISKVLKSAALTYVAGAVSAIGTLLYFALLLFSRTRRSR